MEPLEIKHFPQNILRVRSKPVAEVGQRERDLFEQMLLTMKRACGIGLAAAQVGINQRLLVADIGEGALKLANPEVIKSAGRDNMEEGCLSVPGALVKIERPSEIVVRALNEKGDQVEIEAKGLLARVLLHEIDHLNGKLIIDHMNFLQKVKYKLDRYNQK